MFGVYPSLVCTPPCTPMRRFCLLALFSQHIHELCHCGGWFQARKLWMSVFEVVHNLAVDPATPVVQPWDLLPLLTMPCCESPCLRQVLGAKIREEVFNSPSLGFGPAVPFCLKGGRRPLRLGLAQADHGTLDLVAVHVHSSGLEIQDFVPPHLARLSARLALGMDGVSLD